MVMARLSREARFEGAVIRNIRKLDPDYSLKNSGALWGFPYQIMRAGYLEGDDDLTLRYKTISKSRGGTFLEGRAGFVVPQEFAEERGLSGKRGIQDAGWGLVAYVNLDKQVRFEVVKLPHPKK